MSKRITRSIEYQTEHGESGVAVLATWSVPFSLEVTRDKVEDAEADGIPTLVSLELQVGDATRELPLPDSDEMKQWMAAWVKATKGCEHEMLEQACTEYRDSFYGDLEDEYERRRELARAG